MIFSTSHIVALCGYATLSSAHMLMATPVRFSSPAVTNGPLDAAGANFPCQNAGGAYVGTATSMALGSDQPLSFIGQATHGGGSCQVSITYDTAPTKSSVWRAITDIEGGCPAQNQAGNMGDSASTADPYQYNFTIPDNIPTGKVTLAWTWFNKVGNREMYMNCAPIELTGTSGSQANFDALPVMFTANIGNGCGTTANTDVVFPAPAPVVHSMNGATSAFAPPTGSCQAAAAPATTAAAATSAPAATAAPASSSSFGGIFVSLSTTAPAAATTTAVAPPVTTSAAAPATTSAATSAGTASGVQTPGAACSDEGEWNCIGGTQFQRCASGQWSVMMSVAAGTKCTSGMSDNIQIVAGRGLKGRRGARHLHLHR